MHTLNLGFGQSLLGSAFRMLVASKIWGNGSDEDQYKAAFAEFDSWTKTHCIPQLIFESTPLIINSYKLDLILHVSHQS